MASLSGLTHDAPKMWIECGVTLLEMRGALLESRFYDQRVEIDTVDTVPTWCRRHKLDSLHCDVIYNVTMMTPATCSVFFHVRIQPSITLLIVEGLGQSKKNTSVFKTPETCMHGTNSLPLVQVLQWILKFSNTFGRLRCTPDFSWSLCSK